MISEFGQFIRKLRIDQCQLLKDMAEVLKVSPAFLSAVENGNKSVPQSWKDSLVEHYKLSSQEAEALQDAIDESQRNISIDLSSQSGNRRGVAVSFAREFDSLSDEDLAQLKKTMAELLKRKRS